MYRVQLVKMVSEHLRCGAILKQEEEEERSLQGKKEVDQFHLFEPQIFLIFFFFLTGGSL